MVLPALTHERPLRAYAPRGRRTTGDAQSRLRALPGANCRCRLGTKNSFSNNVRFADLVVMAERLHPIPFRTRP